MVFFVLKKIIRIRPYAIFQRPHTPFHLPFILFIIKAIASKRKVPVLVNTKNSLSLSRQFCSNGRIPPLNGRVPLFTLRILSLFKISSLKIPFSRSYLHVWYGWNPLLHSLVRPKSIYKLLKNIISLEKKIIPKLRIREPSPTNEKQKRPSFQREKKTLQYKVHQSLNENHLLSSHSSNFQLYQMMSPTNHQET